MGTDMSGVILDVLQGFGRPADVEEIAFRVRTTTSMVEDQLQIMVANGLVNREGNAYSINNKARSSGFARAYK